MVLGKKRHALLLNLFQVQYGPTRWGSTLSMINQLIEQRDVMEKCLNSHTHSITLLTDSEWEKLRVIEKLLQPCERVSPAKTNT